MCKKWGFKGCLASLPSYRTVPGKSRQHRKKSRTAFCKNPRGIYLNKFTCEFCRGFGGPFLLEKTGGKNPPKNLQQYSNQNLAGSRPNSTLKGSELEKEGLFPQISSNVLLATQFEIPPHIAQYPFEIVLQRGVLDAFCLVFIWYRASIAEIPLLRGWYRTSSSHALQGGNAQKRGRGYRTQLAMLRHQKRHSAQ